MLTPSELSDIAEINRLAYGYALAVDTRDKDALLALFCTDARLVAYGAGEDKPSTVTTGHAELGFIPDMMRARFTRTAHVMTNHIVHLDGADKAHGSVLCTARHLFANATGGTDLVVMLRYFDKYERRDKRWLFMERELKFLWGETHAALTDAQTTGVVFSG